MSLFTESTVEQAALARPEGLGHTVVPVPQIAPGEPQAGRADYGQVVPGERPPQRLTHPQWCWQEGTPCC
jgi:hypothetical protein